MESHVSISRSFMMLSFVTAGLLVVLQPQSKAFQFTSRLPNQFTATEFKALIAAVMHPDKTVKAEAGLNETGLSDTGAIRANASPLDTDKPFQRLTPPVSPNVPSAVVASILQNIHPGRRVPAPWQFTPAIAAHESLLSIPLNAPQLVVDLSDRQVSLYEGDQVQATYTVAIGQEGWETPIGTFTVIEMLKNPPWEHPITKELIRDDPRNPLGSRWISFWTDGNYAIGFHGTNVDSSVGQAVSHGCLRMLNADIEMLYEQVSLGTTVIVKE